MLQYGGLAALVAIISTAALIVQNRQSNERDDARRRDDATEREKDRLELAKDREEAAAAARADRDHQRQLAEIARDARAAELQKANEHVLDLAARARAVELSERWGDERRAAHLKLLPIFEDAFERLRKASQTITYDESKTPVRLTSGMLSALDTEIRERMAKANAEVQIIGSERSRAAADECQRALRGADVQIWLATRPGGEFTSTQEQIRAVVATAAAAIPNYVDAVRADLGTAG